MGDVGDTDRYPFCTCIYSSFPLYSTDAGTFRTPPPNIYISYYQFTSDFLKGGGHHAIGKYVLLLLPWLITTFPPCISLTHDWKALY